MQLSSPVGRYSDVRSLNKELNDKEYANGQTVLHSKPVAIFVELTQGCNLSCNMCRDEVIPIKSRLMAAGLFEEIAETLFPTAELVDLRGWGESLILPDINERIDAVIRHGARLRLVTNLSFRRDEVLDQLISCQAMIDVSLDAAEEGLLAKVRRGSNLSMISRNLRRLTSTAVSEEDITLLVTVQHDTADHLSSIVDFAADHGVKNVRFYSVTVDPGSVLSLNGDEEVVDRSLHLASTRAKVHGLNLTAGSRLGRLNANPVNLPACIHPWKYCNIAYDGRVGFCDHLIGPGNNEFFVGSLVDQSFDEIWNCEELVRLRTEHLGQRRCSANKFSHCAWCYKNKYVDFENKLDSAFTKYIVKI